MAMSHLEMTLKPLKILLLRDRKMEKKGLASYNSNEKQISRKKRKEDIPIVDHSFLNHQKLTQWQCLNFFWYEAGLLRNIYCKVKMRQRK